MNVIPLAQAVAAYNIMHLAILVVVVAVIVALVMLALRQMGVAIPPWVIQAFWIVVVGLVIIFLIRMFMGLV